MEVRRATMSGKKKQPQPENLSIDIAQYFGATPGVSTQTLAIYLPDRDKDGNRIRKYRTWVKEGQLVLARIGGGSTATSPRDGIWINPDDDSIVSEKTTMIYTYFSPRLFKEKVRHVRNFIHRFGRDTRQGEIVFEFDNEMYRITEYTPDN